MGSDLLSPFEKEEGGREEEHTNAGEDGAAPVDADLFVHGPNEEREGPRRHRSDKRVGGNSAGAVAGECVDEVLEGGLEDGGEAEPRQEDAHDRRPGVRNVL